MESNSHSRIAKQNKILMYSLLITRYDYLDLAMTMNQKQTNDLALIAVS